MNATPSYLLVVALQATVIVVTVLVLMQCALRRPALRHALGVMGLALLLASPLLVFMLPRPGWLTTSQPAPAAEPLNLSETPLTTEFDSSQLDEWKVPEPTSFDRSDVAVVPPVDAGVATLPSEPVPEALEAAETAPTWSERWSATRSAVMNQLPLLLMTVGVVWIVGAVWQLVGWRRSHERLRPLRESLTDWPADRPIYDAGGICEELGVRELPPVKVSEIAPMPLVLGIVGPVVVLPRDFVESTAPGRLRDVVLHEAAHIVRRDPLVFVVQRVVGAMFWWHPGVHWLNRAINRAREEVCDNHVLRRGDAATYAELLVELVESYAGLRRELSLMGLLTSRWSLEQRIAGLLHPKRDTRTRAGRVPAIVAAVLLVMVSLLVGGTGTLGRVVGEAEAAVGVPQADDEKRTTLESERVAEQGVSAGNSASPQSTALVFPTATTTRSSATRTDWTVLWFHSGEDVHFAVVHPGFLQQGLAYYETDSLQPGGRHWEFEGELTALGRPLSAEERPIRWSHDRKIPVAFNDRTATSSVSLDGRTFELAAGRVFVAPAEGAIRQLSLDPPGVETVDKIDGFIAQVEQALEAADELPRPAMRKVTLRGTCVDEQSRAIAGVRVRVFLFASPISMPEPLADLESDAQGNFATTEIDAPKDLKPRDGTGGLFVVGTMPGRSSTVLPINDDAADVQLELKLHGNPGTLSGVVRDAGGQPVSGAAVFLPFTFSEPLEGTASAVTDSDGEFAIPDLERWAATEHVDPTTGFRQYFPQKPLLVAHPDFPKTAVYHTAVPQRVEVTLHPPAIVEGHVIDTVTDQSATGVIVSAQGIDGYGWFQTRTDERGRYRLRMTADRYNIWADTADRIAFAVSIRAASQETVQANIALVAGGFVHGLVIDEETNQPIRPTTERPLTIGHYGPARPRPGHAITSADVQPDGTYRLRVAPGDNDVYVTSYGVSGRTAETVRVLDGEEVTVDFRIKLSPVPVNELPAIGQESRIDHTDRSEGNQWGTIEGRFVFDGETLVPPLRTAQGEVPDESLLVNAGNRGIANVCIYLERAPGQIHPELSNSRSETVAFDSRKLQFVPHILVARTDQSILLKNSNAGPLNVRPMLRANQAINQVIGPNDSTGTGFNFKRSELKHPPLQVSSDLQPWMRAYWIVSDHPYVAVTDADGKFRIENLPAGEHTFRVWHERAGFLNPVAYQRDLKVNVEADKTVTLPVFKVSADQFNL